VTHEEVGRLFAQLDGVVLLVCRLLYGSGLRLLESLHMRVKDVDFERLEIAVRDGKGGKDRVTMLPATCKQELLDHLERVAISTGRISAGGLGARPFLMRLPASTATPTASGDGSTSFRRLLTTPTGAPASGTATTCMRR
jgi:integrase